MCSKDYVGHALREAVKQIARWVTLVTRSGTVRLFVFPLFLISRMTFSSPRPMSHGEFFCLFRFMNKL